MSPTVKQVVTWLDSRMATRVVQATAVVALFLSMWVGVQQYQLTGCLAAYTERSNIAQAARSESAAEDRKLNDAESILADSDRERYRQDAAAMSHLVVTLGQPGVTRQDKAAAYANLIRVNAQTARSLDGNEARRREIRAERDRIEQRRKLSPVPPPPSQTC
ncbi:MAG TPA: hypothetical protein VF755_09480 [Catenuloplanes sp.]|jgi:hypothetical protein